MKKVFLLLLAIFLTTGCSLFKDDLEDATIYTTVYPITYLTETLYGDYAEIESIYPLGADVATYELTEKQISDYSKADLFIYNGLSHEKTTTKNLINENRNLLIIDVSYGLNYTYGIEELWMSPNNYLMLAKNIKDNLIEYLTNSTIIEDITENYNVLAETLSLMDADLRSIGKEAESNGNNTLVVTDDLFYYLETYGFNIISLDQDSTTETSLNNIESAFKRGTYDSIIVLDDIMSEELREIINSNKINVINVSSMVNTKDEDYVSQMHLFIDELRNLDATD